MWSLWAKRVYDFFWDSMIDSLSLLYCQIVSCSEALDEFLTLLGDKVSAEGLRQIQRRFGHCPRPHGALLSLHPLAEHRAHVPCVHIAALREEWPSKAAAQAPCRQRYSLRCVPRGWQYSVLPELHQVSLPAHFHRGPVQSQDQVQPDEIRDKRRHQRRSGSVQAVPLGAIGLLERSDVPRLDPRQDRERGEEQLLSAQVRTDARADKVADARRPGGEPAESRGDRADPETLQVRCQKALLGGQKSKRIGSISLSRNLTDAGLGDQSGTCGRPRHSSIRSGTSLRDRSVQAFILVECRKALWDLHILKAQVQESRLKKKYFVGQHVCAGSRVTEKFVFRMT